MYFYLVFKYLVITSINHHRFICSQMPMSTLQRMLGYGPDGGLSFSYLCDAHGIHCDTEESKVILKRKMFYLPEMPTIYRERFLIDSKLYTSVSYRFHSF